MSKQDRVKTWQALGQGMYVIEALVIGGTVVLTLWGWHLAHWLCWAAGAGAVYGYFWLIGNSKTFPITVVLGVAMCGTAGYFFGDWIFGSPVVGAVWAFVGGGASLKSKLDIQAEIRRAMAGQA